jgi:AAA domain-containing protein
LVRIEPVRWLWPGRIPLGKLTILDGDPGLGKSLITLDLIARVTSGRGMPAELDALVRELSGEPHGAVLLSAEDGLGDTIAPRLLAAGATLERIIALQTVRDLDITAGTTYERSFLLPRDLETLAAAVEGIRARLVVIDPLMAFLDPSINSFRDQDARATLAPLSRLAEATGAAVLNLRHLNKSAGGNALYRGGGSIGIIGAARSGLLAAKDPNDPEHQRVLASSKSNLGPPLPSLRYRLVVDESQTQPRVEWLGACDYTAGMLLAASGEEEKSGALEEATAWLGELLADGPRPGGEIKRLATQAGISERTLGRAREQVCGKPERVGFGGAMQSLWSLRPSEPPAADQLVDDQSA